MKALTTCIVICSIYITANAQSKYFEFNTDPSVEINQETLDQLSHGYWRVYQDDLESRGQTISTQKNVSVCYYSDGQFFYNGNYGTWKVLEGRFIEHQLRGNNVNFGGIFSITKLDSNTMILTKVLTSSQDMKRTLYLKPSTILTLNTQPKGPVYKSDEKLTKTVLDSIRMMSPDELFNAGLTIHNDSMVNIMTADTLYHINLKATTSEYQRTPLN